MVDVHIFHVINCFPSGFSRRLHFRLRPLLSAPVVDYSVTFPPGMMPESSALVFYPYQFGTLCQLKFVEFDHLLWFEPGLVSICAPERHFCTFLAAPFGPVPATARFGHATARTNASDTSARTKPTLQYHAVQCNGFGAGWIFTSGVSLDVGLSVAEAAQKQVTQSVTSWPTCSSGNQDLCNLCASFSSDRSTAGGHIFTDLLFLALHGHATDHSLVGCREIWDVSWTLGSRLCSGRCGKGHVRCASCYMFELLG